VAPEAHAQILDGRVIRTMGSNQPHGTRHFEATGLFYGALAEGYAGAVDMLTRLDDDSDAAPDISVFPAAADPTTGGRQLEEIAFEVLDAERMSHATDKVEKLAARGVRRLFALRVAARAVYEWDHAHHDWTELAPDAEITDRCFRVPIPARALVDRVLADDTVARSLIARRNPVIVAEIERGEGRGRLDGRRAALRTLLDARRLALTEAQSARIDACDDSAALDAWVARAANATRASDVFDA
jgi:hypothetical protein